MLQLLNSLPLNGHKTWLSIAIAVVATGCNQLGYLDPLLYQKIMEWDALLFGVGITHKIEKATAAPAVDTSATGV